MMTLRRSISLEWQTARKPNGAGSKVNRGWERGQAREGGAGVGLGIKREHFLKDVCLFADGKDLVEEQANVVKRRG